MNTPARRDGTPDRRKHSAHSARGGAARAAGSRGARAAQRGGAPRGGAPWENDERGGSRRAPQGGTPRAGRSTGQGAARTGAQGTGRPAGHGAGRPAAQGTGRPGAPSASPPARKAKNPKPQRQAPVAPLLSNAKPARRQNVEPKHTDGPAKLPWGEGERLQKVLAKAGVASRRAAEEMIDQGRVEVDGVIVREQGLRIDPQTAVVRVDGVRVVVRDEQVYVALNKPKGWQSTMSDDLGRPCVGDIVAERIAAGQRLFHVGRLDADTEGLLLLTNDGDLAHRLMHPSFEVSKTYLATVHGEVHHKVIGKRLRDGIELEDGPAKVDRFQVLELGEGRSLVKIVLHEGRKHIVRRLLDAVGHPVTRLVRTHIGPVALGDQRPGTLRVLGRDEIGKLYEAVSL
ncbi:MULTISPECIES: pseudouridine synthase [Nocardia]|uniref:pseudouridine synthase n=1 Tax=Nocardia TaxID=1817 RepID=UPI000D1D72EE|nr:MULTISPECIES: pseudouridine synthase [Nocardia]MBF6189349.1 pseudouridine synthase [Nocardia farcinica]MBF6315113.1 pseudouridine synthase [Nocardia farcinica]MBF6411383.1 pseudouridine synthase [Nocardia farcinica]UEX24658.1 pseudouridine synthase [Nocardia farcinica]